MPEPNRPDQIIYTGDQSLSIASGRFGESYHSIHGALAESRHVFIRNGLEASIMGHESLDVLEAGFGSGLNALLTWQYADSHRYSVAYTAIEYFPPDLLLLQQMASMDPFLQNHQEPFLALHTHSWDMPIELSSHFSFLKKFQKIEELCENEAYDLIYYDAFSPETQPELWDLVMMKKLFQALRPAGILITYCAKGQVKRNLRMAGFDIRSCPGPAFKREITQAIKPI